MSSSIGRDGVLLLPKICPCSSLWASVSRDIPFLEQICYDVDMNWPGSEGSLRELIKLGVLAILKELEVIHLDIDKDTQDLDKVNLIFQVASLAEGLHELEERVSELERHKTTVSWILVLAVAMSFGVFLAYLIGLLR